MARTGDLWRWGACMAMTLALAALVSAQDEPVNDPRVDKLIAALASDSWQARQEAQEALVRLGPVARPALERLVVETRNEEVRTRAQAALRGLEDSRLSGPTLVTLRLKSATPRQVFAELARQGYADIRSNPPELLDSRAAAPADFEVVAEPFWSAMFKACRQWKLSVVTSAPGQLTLSDLPAGSARTGERTVGQAPCSLGGAFAVAALHITRNHSVELNSKENIRRSCSLQLMVLPEPKVRILQGSTMALLTEAVDENGKSLLGAAMMIDQMQAPYSPVWYTHCQLQPPAEAGQRIALRGSLRFVVQTRVETGRVENPLAAKNVETIVAGRRFVLKEMVRKGEMYTAKISAQRSNANVNEFSGQGAPVQFRLLDAQGTPMSRSGTPRMISGTPELAEIEVQFQQPAAQDGQPTADPACLVWDIPIDSREVEVPFEFKDLPMP